MDRYVVEMPRFVGTVVHALAGDPVQMVGALAIASAVVWRLSSPKPHKFQATRLVPAVLLTCIAAAVGLLVGASLAYTLAFGLSHLTGDFVGLPWLTAIPGFAVGAGAGMLVAVMLVKLVIGSLRKAGVET
jgi:hypothetical protein